MDFSTHTYEREQCAVFFRTKEQWGQLANPHTGFPFYLEDTLIGSTEHLYQALRFSAHPDAQRTVLAVDWPIGAKRRAYKPDLKPLTRLDWLEGVNIQAMTWVTALKLALYADTLFSVLKASEGKPIVERSSHDAFWGAMLDAQTPHQLQGTNMLGQIWMAHRQAVCEQGVAPRDRFLQCPTGDLALLGRPLSDWVAEEAFRAAPQTGSLF